MTEDGIRAIADGDLSGGIFNLPGGNESGLLDEGEEILLV